MGLHVLNAVFCLLKEGMCPHCLFRNYTAVILPMTICNEKIIPFSHEKGFENQVNGPSALEVTQSFLERLYKVKVLNKFPDLE